MNYLTTLLGKVLNWKLDIEDGANKALDGYDTNDSARAMWANIVKKMAKIVDQFLPVAMIVLGLVAAIYVIILGTRYSKSESDDEKNEVRKKLINGIIGFAIGLVIMIVLLVFLRNVPSVASWINETGTVKQEKEI